MQNTTQGYLSQANKVKNVSKRIKYVLQVLSLIVVFCVFWGLKITGITLAGEAFCGIQEHAHTEACLLQELACSQEEFEGHSHTDACYQVSTPCPLEAHVHEESCYSDINADVETSDDWEMTMAGLIRSTDTTENIVTVARSQLGYTESVLNFQVDGNGIRRGYTRYGQWYGNPYGDWSAMFASFCLHYAGVEEMPTNAGPEAMRLEWEEQGLYAAASASSPQIGQLLFLDKNADTNQAADAVAIITDIDDGFLYVIEGDLEDAVAETRYAMDDTVLLGYGQVPIAPELMLLAARAPTVIAKTTAYDPSLLTETNSFVIYTKSGTNYYAFDGNGNAVPITIDGQGNISSTLDHPELLLWSFTAAEGANTYLIQNLSTGRYMHTYANNGSGVTTTGKYSSVLIASGNGVKIRSNTEYARFNAASGVFQMTQNQSLAAVYNFGITSRCTLWLDGTNGGIMSLQGSPNKSYSANRGDVVQLPSQWDSPEKYSYTLRGWYDVTNGVYYAPGAEVTVQENMVLYADWVASSYDIGRYNSFAADTVSTNDFVTTRVFDYNTLFNLYSLTATGSAGNASHTESWSLVNRGNVASVGNQSSLEYIFVDYDGNGSISYPTNNNGRNQSAGVYSGLYTNQLGSYLFGTDNSFDPSTGSGILGKQYLGTADHLFQIMTDPDNEYYGYYYYDSRRNAASYNRSAGRFFVYDYLERTADSAKDGGVGEFSDFLPFNSPYANTNGKNVVTYSYSGDSGEYNNVTHYMYDAKYNTNNNSTGNVGTNYWFGMSIDIDFYLPNSPGDKDEAGQYGNQDLYGKDMHFKFSGDDDVWVLVDGKLVLDIGGVHGVETGDINFSTGIVTVDGTQTGTITDLASGEHTLTIYYLERGSSQSNCAIYFNLAPRYSFSIQKEDVLTRKILNGAQFSVYTDRACTVPAELWDSEASYKMDQPAGNTFTVVDGVANMWGLSAGNTYYIKETRGPDAEGYGCANGIICLTLDKLGLAYYEVEILDEGTVSVSPGFTVHGIKIDEETQHAYIVATNAPEWVQDATTVRVTKDWDDDRNHDGDAITVYLTVTDQDGTVRRIRETQLGAENDWVYTWTNLPKYAEDGVTKIQYGVEEAYFPGYYPTVEIETQKEVVDYELTKANGFVNGGEYILQTGSGCLSTSSGTAETFAWVDVNAAKTSPLAKWTATVSGSGVKLVNGAGQILTFRYNTSSSNRYFYATTASASYQTLYYTASGGGYRLAGRRTSSGTSYYFTGIGTNGRGSNATSSASAMIFTLNTLEPVYEEVPDGSWRYKIINRELETETSLSVSKLWDYGFAENEAQHEQAQVTVKLLANGRDTGRTLTLSLRNGWRGTFLGLPYTDDAGNVISYTVQEVWVNYDWIPHYGDIVPSGGTDPPTYTTTITNEYRWGTGALLPSTGSPARLLHILCGCGIMLAALVYRIGIRRKRERREI